MNKLKDAIEELKIIKDYVNAHSGCDEINIKLDADGNISACDGRVMFFFKTVFANNIFIVRVYINYVFWIILTL